MIVEISKELDIPVKKVMKAVELLDEGNTVPFIARYRKEVTGNLEDQQLRNIEISLKRLRNLEERKGEVLRSIKEQDKLTEDLEKEINDSKTLKEVEDLYLPYKKKRRTRATMAKEKGYEPLSDYILNWEDGFESIEDYARKFAIEESVEEAIKGAEDIIAEIISETPVFRNLLRYDGKKFGIIVSSFNPKSEEKESKYESYYDFSEYISDLPSHRILAINRGEKDGFLKVDIRLSDKQNIEKITNSLVESKDKGNYPYIFDAVSDSYSRLLAPSIENELRRDLTEKADEESIEIFSNNLRPYLMQAPIEKMVVMGVDPAFRTGCKIAIVNEYGDFLDNDVIYPVEPHNRVVEGEKIVTHLINKYDVKLIAIGNGTASRETESFISNLLKKIEKKVYYTIVNESGASIYSASEIGIKEFPQLDVTVRGAISIARRIQDPLAELVKIEPKHIGVGQYQHDVNQKKLEGTLETVVEDCVNQAGVYVNSSSFSLLNYVSGVSPSIAKNILEYKEENGPFRDRKELLKVKGVGKKTFEQMAGFLRIQDGDNPLDNTAVHPESYKVAVKLKEDYKDIDKIDIEKTAKDLDVGIPTLRDIIEELKRPGRDPREDMPKAILRNDVLTMDDLKENMILTGTVRNVVNFGAFVDIGVETDGLVHISELSDRYVKNPMDVVQVGDEVKVRIIELEKNKNRISLSMKGIS